MSCFRFASLTFCSLSDFPVSRIERAEEDGNAMEAEETNFGVVADSSGLSIDQLAVSARGSDESREELYQRLFPAMKRAVRHYMKSTRNIEESDCYYQLYLATERAVKGYDESRHGFLRYWSRCASLALLKAVVQSSRRPALECQLEVEIPYEEPRLEVASALDGYFESVIENRQSAYGAICAVLMAADYSSAQVAEMLDISQSRVKLFCRSFKRGVRAYTASRQSLSI